MRLMAGVLAGHPFTTSLIGDASLSRRPMRRVIEPLERMGARIDATDGRPPLTIHGAALHAITHQPDVPSAQVKSAVLLAGLHADGTTTVIEPAQTRDHTERALGRSAGTCEVDQAGTRSRSPAGSVCGADAERARRLLVRRVLDGGRGRLPWSRVEIEDVGLNPTRTALIDVLRRFGARVEVEQTSNEAGEPRGTIIVSGDRIGRVDIGPEEVPGLIDELPAIAALAAHGGEVTVRGAAELRVKESDRIAALVAGFRALGIEADERPDGFVVGKSGQSATGSGQADARGDHRMAMAFAIAALARTLAVESTAPTRSRFPIPASSRRWPGSSRESRQGLPGRIHGGRQDHRRPRAGEAARLAGRGHRRAHRAARAPAGLGHLRETRRAVLPRRRTRGARRAARHPPSSWSPPAAARSSTRQNRAAINHDGVSVWLDVPLDRLIARVPADGRRPLAADRAEFERLYHARRAAYEQAHLRLDAGRASVDALVEQFVDWLEA